MPNNESDRRPLRLVTNEELHSLIQSRNSSGFVNMLHPMELDVPRDALDTWTRRSLEQLRNDEQTIKNPAERATIRRAIQQRIDFLAWLQVQEEDEIHMAIYPADMDGLDDLEDLDEVIDTLPPNLPF